MSWSLHSLPFFPFRSVLLIDEVLQHPVINSLEFGGGGRGEGCRSVDCHEVELFLDLSFKGAHEDLDRLGGRV